MDGRREESFQLPFDFGGAPLAKKIRRTGLPLTGYNVFPTNNSSNHINRVMIVSFSIDFHQQDICFSHP